MLSHVSKTGLVLGQGLYLESLDRLTAQLPQTPDFRCDIRQQINGEEDDQKGKPAKR